MHFLFGLNGLPSTKGYGMLNLDRQFCWIEILKLGVLRRARRSRWNAKADKFSLSFRWLKNFGQISKVALIVSSYVEFLPQGNLSILHISTKLYENRGKVRNWNELDFYQKYFYFRGISQIVFSIS